MGDRHDYVALEWVKGEIAETLKQARQALEAFVENPQDSTRMRFCLTYVHQVQGTLQMVEFYGAALLAEEMEQLAQALMEGRVTNQGEALEVLMQAILQLPVYLDRIQTARRDLPMVVLPLLNDLRAARGEKLLSETSLFAPDMSARPAQLSAESLSQLGTAELPALLRKLRQMLQVALVGVVRGQDLPVNLGYMARVFARLENLCKDAPLGPLWQITSGLVEGLAAGSVSNGTSVRTLLRQVDKELKRLVEQGAAGFNQPAPDELAKNLLFYVAKAPAQSPRISALKEHYRLDDALPDSQVVDEERARLAGPDRDAMRSVVGALCEELVRVKDSLDLFVRSDRQQVSELDSLLAPLKQIADTLAVLGFGQPRKVIVDQIEVVQGLATGRQAPSDAVLMDVAGALLYVEATLAGMVGPAEEGGREESHLPTTDVAQIHQLVIKEARNGLEQAKDAIIEFIASQWNHEHLARVPDLLTQVRGGLAMIPLPRAAQLLNACNRYIQEQLLARKAVPNWQSLDTLADAITSVEYYLERLAEDHATQGDLILDVAEESLESLGYPLTEKPSILDQVAPESAPEPAPLDDPLNDIEVLDAASDLPPLDSVEPQSETLDSVPDDELTLAFDELPGVTLEEPTLEWDLQPLDEPLLSLDEPDQLPELPVLELDEMPAEQGLGEALLLDELQPDSNSADELSDLAQWSAAEMDALDLPEVDLPAAPEPVVEPVQTEDKALSMADVMAAPAQAINPPAHDVPPSLLPPPPDEEPIDDELLEVFIEEAGEVLETIAEFLPRWIADSNDKDALTEVRRAFHTLKGSGRMVRALIIGELAWSIENLLNRVLDRSIAPDEAVHDVINQVVALMPALVDEFAAKAQRQRDDVDQLASLAHALARGQRPPKPEAPGAVVAEPEGVSEAAVEDGEVLDPQLLEIFRNEAETHLDTLNTFLAECAREVPQPVTDDLQRALHTLKGSAYMAGILPIAEIAAPLEKMVKEFKTNLIPMDLAEAELLSTAEQLFRAGLAQLDDAPLAPLPGAPEFLERAQALHQERLDSAEYDRQEGQGDGRDPQLIGIFLAEGMDILLDAEGLLRQWREHPSERQELSALLDELTTLGRGAEMAELPQIDELCEALLDLYGAVEEGSLAVSERFFSEAEAAHEALIGMMDQVAAGLQVTAQPDRVQALRDLLDEALDPSTLALLTPGADGVQVVELDAATAAIEAQLDTADEPLPPLAMVSDSLDEEMVDIFLEEAVDILESAGKALERWLAEPDNRVALSSLQRDLHTLKGGARMAEIRPIGDLGHELESLYEGLMDRRYSHSPALAELLLSSHDRLATLLEQLQGRQVLQQPNELIEAIRRFRQGDSAPLALLDEPLQPEPEAEAEAEAEPDADAEEAPDEIVVAEPAAIAESFAEPLPAEPERDPELVEIFLEEGFDIVDSSSAALQRWMDDTNNSLELEALQRDLHTLKGGARMAEIREIGDLAHELEFLYEGLADGRLRASAGLFELLQACHDRLAQMLEAVRSKQPVPDGQALIEAIKRFRANPDEQLSIPTAVQLRAAAPNTGLDDDESDILDIFLEEADDLLEVMEASIGRFEAQRDDGRAIDDILRVLHTLKGGARLAGQKRLGDLTHDLESHLTEAQQQGAPWPESLFLDLQSGFEGLQTELDQLRQRLLASQAADVQAPGDIQSDEELALTPSPAPQAHVSLIAASEAVVQNDAPRVLPFVQRAEQAAQEAASRRAPQELVKVPAELLEGLVNLAGETSIFRGRVEQQVSDFGFTLSEMEATIDRVRDQLRRLDIETQAQILSRYQSEVERVGYEDFDPLEMDRHSQLQQLSRALFESASDLLDLKETLATRNRDAETLLLQQARVNTELQEGLMRTRMVPFDRLVPRLRRIVRQVASELGKQVEFLVGNAEGEMDRTVLERIVAPLEHMLRNAVDHGIEPAQVRRDSGKPEQGSIRLSLGREGGDIVLTLADDGAGIKLDAVRRKAIERGLMDADAGLSDHEVLQFILEAGFSTAEKVTQISGRGVGMDVVHSEVKQLGGSMSIESTPGEGTTFTIRLPFTVSVNRALMVLSGEDLYAIPLNTIEGIVRVSPYELEAYYGPDAPRFEYAGQAYELRYLGDLLNNGQHPKLVGQSLPLPVILVRSSEHAVAVQVDSLAGSREIVVKSLGPQFAGVHGISGATILGDGRVVVILDLLATIRVLHAHLQNQLQPRLAGPSSALPEVEAERPTLVMVVDDSITVRKVTSRLLERNGMNVLTAKDGVDAIAQLQEHKPDIMLLDIEMPRMDGFEVATLVRHDEGLKDLPIIMITSRTGEKHRERAMSIGVNQYLGKPYQESLLLETIAQLVHSRPVGEP
ncbi:chemosensory pili system protein ChpA (sensor histidine kinase/response regulator) [Pseudomonas cuatrocienegasensis]|uniref:histidine kinase n=1 Tax=Pseudomonas cuatrocienegasensis TaxID=543360 RepID=A0ABY1B6B5_9PSED|nr:MULTISPECIES: Hpt domain-containing protein [Pseudomonas]OEC36762.1 hybrid sensor histidine kinase/response regulator [Pseudomonas sp. 21C1]SEQ05869.1 chemosensory pili system protein ChpA (sensor histidine kinase/response regulator) [Pseudomonas cuatrocienegasensis]